MLSKLKTIEFSGTANLAKLKLTYMYVALGIFCAIIGLSVALPYAAMISTAVFIGIVLVEFAVLFLFIFKKNVFTYSAFTFLTGVTLVPVISSLLTAGASGIILQAFVGTFLIVCLLTTYTLTTKKDFMSLNTILLYILIGVIVISLINLFIGSSILNLIISVVVMILFSFFIIVNTQEVLYTDIEPLDAACSLYLDILNMFIALLNILSFSKD